MGTALILLGITGLAYPAAVTGVAQLLFPRQANGSLVTTHGDTSSSACSKWATVVLIPGGSMLRSRPILSVSITAAWSSQSTARRGLQTQTAKSSATGSSPRR